MSKGIILYKSKYGATKKYAQMLSETLEYDIIETKKADIKNIKQYNTIIIAGGIYASGIAGIGFFKKNISQLNSKRLAMFCVGASPLDEKAFEQIRNHNLKEELSKIPCFYGRGAWNEKAMSFADKTLCKMLQKVIAKKDPATYEPWEQALMSAIGKQVDWTDKEYLTPLLSFLDLK